MPKRGLFRLGPFYITPTLNIGPIGLDTNVFYTATDRRTDLTARGGPGLKLLLPIREALDFTIDGAADYVHFVRTRSLRRLNGTGTATLQWSSPRTQAALIEATSRTFSRPNLEVDRRVVQDQEGTILSLNRRLFGRTGIRAGGSRVRTTVDRGETFLGTDLGETLTRDEYRGQAALTYALTVKTSAWIEAAREASRFPLLSARDGNLDRVVFGVMTSSTTLISGRASVGVGRFQLTHDALVDRRLVMADVAPTIHFSQRTRLLGSYSRALEYAALRTAGPTPTRLTEIYGVELQREILYHRLELRLFGRVTRLETDGAVIVDLADEQRVVAPRSDEAQEGGASLQYRFRSHLAIGVVASYLARKSSIAYFEIDGLLIGATVTFNP